MVLNFFTWFLQYCWKNFSIFSWWYKHTTPKMPNFVMYAIMMHVYTVNAFWLVLAAKFILGGLRWVSFMHKSARSQLFKRFIVVVTISTTAEKPHSTWCEFGNRSRSAWALEDNSLLDNSLCSLSIPRHLTITYRTLKDLSGVHLTVSTGSNVGWTNQSRKVKFCRLSKRVWQSAINESMWIWMTERQPEFTPTLLHGTYAPELTLWHFAPTNQMCVETKYTGLSFKLSGFGLAMRDSTESIFQISRWGIGNICVAKTCPKKKIFFTTVKESLIWSCNFQNLSRQFQNFILKCKIILL